jgi:hypothetical protein
MPSEKTFSIESPSRTIKVAFIPSLSDSVVADDKISSAVKPALLNNPISSWNDVP